MNAKATYDIDALRRRAAELGWTQTMLARLAGITTSRVSRLFAGIHQSRATVRAVCAALGVAPADVLRDLPAVPRPPTEQVTDGRAAQDSTQDAPEVPRKLGGGAAG